MSSKILIFDGTMLVSSGKLYFKNAILNTVGFEQTTVKRNPGAECPDAGMKPDVLFVFESRESIDSVVRVLNHLKQNFGISDIRQEE